MIDAVHRRGGGTSRPPTPAPPPRRWAASVVLLSLAVGPVAAEEKPPVGADALEVLQAQCVEPLNAGAIPHAEGLAPLPEDRVTQFQRILGLMGVADADPEGQSFWVTGSTKLIYLTRDEQPYCVVFGFDAEYLEVRDALRAWQSGAGAAFTVDGDFALPDASSGRPALASASHKIAGGETVRLTMSYDPKLAGLFVAAADRVTAP